VTDVDCVAFYESPVKKLARQGPPARGGGDLLEPFRAEREIREVLGFEGRLETFDHHASHAASTFFYSGSPEAAVLTVDGVGEWATTMIAGVARRSTFPPAGYGVASTA
jgi:carbamoyltransferase